MKALAIDFGGTHATCGLVEDRVLCLLKTLRIRSIKYLERVAIPAVSAKILRMIAFLRHLFGWILSTFGSRKNLALENLALRQPPLALHSKRPRPRFSTTQKFVLGCSKEILVRLAEAIGSGNAENCDRVALYRLPAVLEMLI